MSTWTQTWSAPASRCSCTRPAIGRLVAPDDQRVDEAVAAAVGDVVVGEAEPPPVVGVVGQAEVGGEVQASGRPSSVGIGVQHDALLGRHQAVGADRLAGDARVLGRDEVGVRPGGARAGELEHLRPEGGEHPVGRGERRIGGVEAVEERRHLGQRALVRAGLLHPVDERRRG